MSVLALTASSVANKAAVSTPLRMGWSTTVMAAPSLRTRLVGRSTDRQPERASRQPLRLSRLAPWPRQRHTRFGRSTEEWSPMATTAEPVTSQLILDAARTRLLADGYARLSTRKVAQEAGVPLSQVHYHFGSKGGMVLAVLEAENERRLARQTSMYA